MSSTQSLTITEMLGFRALLAVIARLLALVRWSGQGVRDVRRGDSFSSHGLIGSVCWAFAPLGGQSCSAIIAALWRSTPGGREGPWACELPWLVLTAAQPRLNPAPALRAVARFDSCQLRD